MRRIFYFLFLSVLSTITSVTASKDRESLEEVIRNITDINEKENVKELESGQLRMEARDDSSETVKNVFAPRMDYDQWKPIGRGDPLKNDPTYDYVPPVLDRVRYWIEPEMRKPENMHSMEGQKSEILVLGVSSKKPSVASDVRRDSFDYHKYIDPPKFHHHHNMFPRPNPQPRPQHPQNYYHMYHKHKNENQVNKNEEQRVPYTVLMPPPIQQFLPEMSFYKILNKPSTSTTIRPISTTISHPVSVQEANLIFQSSSTGDADWGQNYHHFGSEGSDSQRVTWRTPVDSNVHPQETSAKESSYRILNNNNNNNTIDISMEHVPIQMSTNADTVIFPSSHVVFEQPDSGASTVVFPSNQTSPILLGPLNIGSNMHVLHVSNVEPTIAHISVGSQAMHKGLVSDDTIESTYVNIGKPNAHIQSVDETNVVRTTEKTKTIEPMMEPMMKMPVLPTVFPNSQINSVYSNSAVKPHNIMIDPAIQFMQTMQPPPIASTVRTTMISRKPTGSLHSILFKEKTTAVAPVYTSTSTQPTPTMSSITTLTTDPLFKHYKQPTQPFKGPMYLIIQGHSKVKTYGPSDKKQEVDPPQETNEIPLPQDKYQVKHLHTSQNVTKKESNNTDSSRSKSARSLKQLVNAGVGSLQIKEAKLGIQYDVSAGDAIPIEVYHKGTVENEENEFILQKRKESKSERAKRQLSLEDLIPVEEVDEFVYDYLKYQSEGSGVGALVASAVTSDAASVLDVLEDDDDDDEDLVVNDVHHGHR